MLASLPHTPTPPQGLDILTRQAMRRGTPAFLMNTQPSASLAPLRPWLPEPVEAALRSLLRPVEMLDEVVPRLTRDEELYALALVDLTARVFGPDAALMANGDWLGDPQAPVRLVLGAVASGQVPGVAGDGPRAAAVWLQQNLMASEQQRRRCAPPPPPPPLQGSSETRCRLPFLATPSPPQKKGPKSKSPSDSAFGQCVLHTPAPVPLLSKVVCLCVPLSVDGPSGGLCPAASTDKEDTPPQRPPAVFHEAVR